DPRGSTPAEPGSALGDDDHPAARLLAHRDRPHALALVHGVVHDLAVSRAHGLEGLLGARRPHLLDQVAGEALEGLLALLAVAAHLDEHPTLEDLVPGPLHGRAREGLDGLEGRPART